VALWKYIHSAQCTMWQHSETILPLHSLYAYVRHQTFTPSSSLLWVALGSHCQYFLQQCGEDLSFSSHALFADEAGVTSSDILNFHNRHILSDVNPHSIRQTDRQTDRQTSTAVFNECLGFIVGHCFVGPHSLPELLDTVPLDIRRNMWFMHDDAPAHFSYATRNHIETPCTGPWVVRQGPVPYPSHSPDLNPLSIFLWWHQKNLVHASVVDTAEELLQHILNGCTSVHNTPGISFWASTVTATTVVTSCHWNVNLHF
jgi:hypothetical protein